jgi:hypothetical protein
MMKLSASEQRLVDFACGQFGEQLCEFLLAGLGEETAGQRGRFNITYASGEDSVLKRHVEVITYEPADGSSYLPRGRQPLILITLLYLLMNSSQKSPNTLRYEMADVLSLLGWKDTKKARREIDEAGGRYFKLTYTWKMNDSELAEARLNSYTANEAMISEYESTVTNDGESARIVFNEFFIKHLLGQSLFGIEWNNVSSVLLQFPSRK